jgi:iron complex outermembrane recepter protein
MLRKTRLASVINSTTIASTLAATAVAVPVFSIAEEEALEEVVVTGSRIKRADLESASPVTVITREELIISGNTDVGAFLQSMPSASGSPIGTTTNNGGDGSVRVDLRGMGSARTLSLVNGRRTVDGGDYQTIPTNMIERVEILKDGASAVYGADAVAGVVNIITRSSFDGIEVSAQSSTWADTENGNQDSVNLIMGKQVDEGHFVFGAEYVKQEAIYQRDTPWDFMQDSYYIYPEGCENQVAAPYDGTATGGCFPIGSSRIPESRLSFLTQGTFLVGTPASQPYEVGSMIKHDGRTYNYAPVNFMQTPYERTNLFAEGAFDLTDNVQFNATFRASNRTSKQELAPLPFTGGDPMYDGTFNGTAYTGVSDQNYYLRRAVDSYNAANAAAITAGTVTALVYEPLSNPRRRMIETTRYFTQDVLQYEGLVELTGEFQDLNWNVYVNKGYNSTTAKDYGQFSGRRLYNALGPSADLDGNGQPECYTDVADASTLIKGCVPLNLFGGGSVERSTGIITASTLTQDMIDYVSLDTVDTYTAEQTTAGFSFSGESFELPGGKLGWAVGYDYWLQEFDYTPDSAKTIGAVTGNVGAGTVGSLKNDSVFVELLAPVFDNGVQSVVLKAGWRYDDWDAFEGDTTWQLGAEFQVVEDLKLRATAGTIFRVPGIFDLFGGLVDSFPQYSDPCVITGTEVLPAGCAQVGVQLDSQVNAQVGGNPNLTPETGDTLTAGLVWTPTFGDHGVTVTVDYWSIELEDGISSLGVQTTLNNCYIEQSAGACGLITRAADYSVLSVRDTQLNVSELTAKGVDSEARWSYDSSIGQLEASVLWAHMLERTNTAFAGEPESDFAGRYVGSAFAEDKVSYSLSWGWNDLSVTYRGEYISALDADTFCNCGAGNRDDGSYVQEVESQLYHDLTATYAAPYNIRVSAGVTNVTNEAPPYLDVGFNANTDPATYREFGRGYYVRLAWAQ